MSELISRQTVINEIANTCFWLSGDDWNELIECINSIPSVENKGEWISTEDRPFGFCSKCDRDMDETSTPYCPYCGAKMTWVGAISNPIRKENEK